MRPQFVAAGIVATALITAVIHLSFSRPLLQLNGLGYLVLLAAFFLPWPPLQRYHSLLRWVFAGYTLVTIAGYFILHPNGSWQTDRVGMFTKLVEVILLLLLIYDGQSAAIEEGEVG